MKILLKNVDLSHSSEVSKDAINHFQKVMEHSANAVFQMKMAVAECNKISNKDWYALVKPLPRHTKIWLKRVKDIAESKVHIEIDAVNGHFANHAKKLPFEIQEKIVLEGVRMPLFDSTGKKIGEVNRRVDETDPKKKMTTLEMRMAIDDKKNKIRSIAQMEIWYKKEMKALLFEEQKPKGKVIDRTYYKMTNKGIERKGRGIMPYGEIPQFISDIKGMIGDSGSESILNEIRKALD